MEVWGVELVLIPGGMSTGNVMSISLEKCGMWICCSGHSLYNLLWECFHVSIKCLQDFGFATEIKQKKKKKGGGKPLKGNNYWSMQGNISGEQTELHDYRIVKILGDVHKFLSPPFDILIQTQYWTSPSNWRFWEIRDTESLNFHLLLFLGFVQNVWFSEIQIFLFSLFN